MSNEHYLQITYSRNMGGGNTIVNVFHIAPDAGGWAGADRTAIANYWIGRLKTFYDAAVDAGVEGGGSIGGTVIEYENGEAPIYVPATAQSVALGVGGASQPLQLAACVSWRTALAGRAYRGRTYLGPLTATAMNGQSLTSTFVNKINLATPVLIAGASGSFKLSVMSKTGTHWRKNGHLADTPVFHDGFTTHITSGSTTNAVRTMRSRN